MAKLFDLSIENLIEELRKQRIGKRVFAFETLIGKRIIRDGGTPIIEGDSCHFFHLNDGRKKISLVGDWNNWKPGADVLNPINPRSTLWYIKKEFAMDSRLSYRFQSDNEGSFND